jgi:uncharacterized protein
MRRRDREVTSHEEIVSIIHSSDVCRVAFADNNTPYVVTMNFGFSDGPFPVLYFHCAQEGRKTEMIRKNNYVCFEMDTDHKLYKGEKGCDWGMSFRSVVGYGRIFIVEEESEREKGLGSIMDQYGGKGPYSYDNRVLKETAVLRLEILEMTAKIKN